jgi:hypothetical protein
MTITYWLKNVSDKIKAIIEEFDILPAPAGVGIRIVYGLDVFFGLIADGEGDYTNPKRQGLVNDNEQKDGEMFMDGDDVNS